jgi:hypothetical protein
MRVHSGADDAERAIRMLLAAGIDRTELIYPALYAMGLTKKDILKATKRMPDLVSTSTHEYFSSHRRWSIQP